MPDIDVIANVNIYAYNDKDTSSSMITTLGHAFLTIDNLSNSYFKIGK